MSTSVELQTRLTVDNANFKRGIDESRIKVEGFSKSSVASMLKIGVAVAALGYAFKTAFNSLRESEERISKLADTSTRLGIAVGPLQKLQFVAEQSGIEIDTMNLALGKMQKTLGAAMSGSAQAAKAFTDIGLSVSDLAKMDVAGQYVAISDAIKGIGSTAEQNAASWGIFGRAGSQQLSALKDNVRGMMAEFEGLGIELSGNQVRSVEHYGDEVKKLDVLWEGFKGQLTAALAGPLTEMIQSFEANIKEMGGMGVAAQRFANIIVPILKDIAALAKLAALPFEGLDDIIKATALGAAKLAEIRAKSQLSNATDLKEIDPEGFAKASTEYIHATAYLKAMKEEIKDVTVAKKAMVDIGIGPDLSGGGTGLNTAMDTLGIQQDITNKLTEQKTAVETAISLEKQKYEAQKDATDEMRKQIDASHTLYENAVAQRDFDKQRKQDLDSIAASIRQDAQETAAGIGHAGDRNKDLDNYMPDKDKQGHVLSSEGDSERTQQLKEDYNNKIDDRAEQKRHTELLNNIQLVSDRQAQEEKEALAKMNATLEAIKASLSGGGGGGVQTPATQAQYDTTDKQAPWSFEKTNQGGGIPDLLLNNTKSSKVDVNVSASEDFIIKVVNSDANKTAIQNVSASQLQSAVSAGQ